MPNVISPFRIAVSQHAIDDLRARLRVARVPKPVPASGWTLGMDADYLSFLLDEWLNHFDWRSVEAHLNSFPQFMAEVGAAPVHFVHLTGSGPSRTPIILTHGWPSTFAELLKLGQALAKPTSNGSLEAEGFDVIIPSLPGYAFSPAPKTLGTNVFTIASQWAELMTMLGYDRFVAHGGDIGAGVTTALALLHGERLHGIHLNYIPGSYRPFLEESVALTAEECEWQARRDAWNDAEGGYSHLQGTKPDVLGPALNDSPIGLAAWIIDKYRSWSDCDGDVGKRFSITELLTVVSIYWFTECMPSAIRLYWEGRRRPIQLAADQRVSIPVAVAHFPKEIPIPPRSYVERGYNVARWTEFPRGGHFAALEETAALGDDIRSFTRELRAKESKP